MRRIETQRGEGNLGCILWALVAVVAIHVSWMMVPVKIANAQLSDFMEDQAEQAEHRSPEELEKRILAKARELNVPLDPKKLEVQRRRDHIYMKGEYTQPVRFFGGYTYEWHFVLDIDRPIFIF